MNIRSCYTILAMSMMASGVAVAKDTPLGVTSEHKPNEYTLACLANLNRDCALTAAMQTTIAEEFGLERAKVLTGVASALIDLGDHARAQKTLMLAVEEARSARLTLVMQEKISEIAPLLSKAGDVAGALALTQEIQIPIIKDRVLAEIAKQAALSGSIADARTAYKQMENQKRAFWLHLTVLSQAGEAALMSADMNAMEAGVRLQERPDRLYRGLILLAIIEARRGNGERAGELMAEADEQFHLVLGYNVRAEITANRLRDLYNAGVSGDILEDSYQLALLHGSRLRGEEALHDFILKVGPVEYAMGYSDSALARFEDINQTSIKADYVASIDSGAEHTALNGLHNVLLAEINEVESAYERDNLRVKLLKGAIARGDLGLSRDIVTKLEDDDNQGLGVALIAPIAAE